MNVILCSLEKKTRATTQDKKIYYHFASQPENQEKIIVL